MSDIRIENIVASTTLADSLDLTQVSMFLEDAEYDPAKFPGLVYRIKEVKTAMLLFRSGKANCTGGKNLEAVEKSVKLVLARLRKNKVKVHDKPKITVQNIVAVFDLGREMNLMAVAVALGLERVEYEPEQFPGLVYRLDDPKVVMLVFQSGKVVCTGATNEDDVGRARARLMEDVAIVT